MSATILKSLTDRVRTVRQGVRDRAKLRHIGALLSVAEAGAGSVPKPVRREVVVSLTSFAKRFAHLELTLRSLISQSVTPDRIILYLSHADAALLPPAVRALQGMAGFEVRTVKDQRSFTKLIYALADFPEAYIVTVDDDLIYPPDLIAELLSGVVEGDRTVVCHRAHRLVASPSGGFAPYREWEWDVQDDAARRPSTDIMPTGVSGVLYPPEALPLDAQDAATFLQLCPRADDVWFYWQARLAGTRHRKVGAKFVFVESPQTQEFGLRHANWDGGNDSQIAAMLERYGSPLETRTSA